MLMLLAWCVACQNPGSGVPDAMLESCNGEDDDEDGLVDEDARDAAQLYTDQDGDGFGAPPLVRACPGTPGATPDGSDCDDEDDDTWPGAPETCGDGVYNDCTGTNACRYDATQQMRYGALVVDSDWPDRAHFGTAAGLGDVDGDGLDDVAFGDRSHSTNEEYDGGSYVFRGGRNDHANLSDADGAFVGSGWHLRAGWRVVGGHDVDGDGVSDILVQPDHTSHGSWLIPGANAFRTGQVDGAAIAIVPAYAQAYGQSLAGVDDIDGDGFGEVLAGEFRAPGSLIGEPGAVYLFRGPLSGNMSRDEASTTWWGEDGMELGRTVKHVGDLTGDGRSDVAFAAWQDPDADMTGIGMVFVASDPPPGALGTRDVDATIRSASDYQGAGIDLAGDGDVDGDGHGDLIITAVTVHDTYMTGAWLLRGPFAGDYQLGIDEEAEFLAVHGVDGTEHGVSAASPGDMDGDGFGEVVLGWSKACDATHCPGVLSIFYGPVTGTRRWDTAEGLVWGEGDWNQPAKPGMLDSAGDFDGDGLGDLVVAGWGGTEEYPNPIGFVLLGGNP